MMELGGVVTDQAELRSLRCSLIVCMVVALLTS